MEEVCGRKTLMIRSQPSREYPRIEDSRITVGVRKSRHLAITFEVGHRSCDRRSNLCSHLEKAFENSLLPQPTLV